MLKFLTSATLLAAGLAGGLMPIAASAQNERSSPIPRYHLMQLAVDADGTSAADFQAKTETIRSCGDARKVAKSTGATIKRNRFISASALPETLRDTLAEMPSGHATQVTSGGAKHRVVVLCNRA